MLNCFKTTYLHISSGFSCNVTVSVLVQISEEKEMHCNVIAYSVAAKNHASERAREKKQKKKREKKSTERRPYRLKRIHLRSRNQFKMVRVMALLLRSCGRLIIFTFPRNLCHSCIFDENICRTTPNENGKIIYSIRMQANPLYLPATFICIEYIYTCECSIEFSVYFRARFVEYIERWTFHTHIRYFSLSFSIVYHENVSAFAHCILFIRKQDSVVDSATKNQTIYFVWL